MRIKIPVILLISCLMLVVHGQDIIYLKDGSEIKSKVIEIEEANVKYKRFDQQDGPLRNVSNSEIFLIIYEDGTREVFARPNQAESQSNPQSNGGATAAGDADSAVLYVYRPDNYTGFAVVYDLYAGNEKVGKVSNKSKLEVVLKQEGPLEVWAKTEKKVSVFLDVKFGETYYLKCGVATGAWVGHPDLMLVPSIQGEPEYARIKGKRSKKK